MFGSTKSAAAYRSVEIETELATASPHKLVLMLLDGALMAISAASTQMAEKRTAEKGQSISKAINIIINGLNASLDAQAGGALAERLGALYEYMGSRLLYANLRNDPAALEEVSKLLREIRGGWEEIASDPAVLSKNKEAA